MISPTRTVIPHGLTRFRLGAIHLGVAALIGLFLLVSLGIWHGVGAWIVLGLTAIALTVVGGPVHRARQFEFSADELVIERFTRVVTRIRAEELVGVRVVDDPRVELVLEPRDPAAFFTAHRELRVRRSGSTARIPAGQDPRTAADLQAALDLLVIKPA